MIEETFVDPEPVIADRSTLEQFASCPAKGIAIGRKLVADCGVDADCGTAAHDVISAAVQSRLGGAGVKEIADLINEGALHSRPDLQPMVVARLRPAAWTIARILCEQDNASGERHPDDLLRFDGGDVERSGQLAADIELSGGPVRVTGELDLLMATTSPAELDLIDWKSGFKWYTASDIYTDFQFRTYSWLIFRNYPGCEVIRVRVVMTASNIVTAPAEFRRKNMAELDAHIRQAASTFAAWREAAGPDQVPTWPSPDKCNLCAWAHRCTAGNYGDLVAANPMAALTAFVQLSARHERLQAQLRGYVREFGDISNGSVAFGVNKPRAARAPVADLYEVK